MPSTVSARIPTEIKHKADSMLKDLGATQTDLINAAYTYLVTQGRLPTADPEATNTMEPSPTTFFVMEDALRGFALASAPLHTDMYRLLIMASFGDLRLCASAFTLYAAQSMVEQRVDSRQTSHTMCALLRYVCVCEGIPWPMKGGYALITLEPSIQWHDDVRAYTPAQLVAIWKSRGLQFEDISLLP